MRRQGGILNALAVCGEYQGDLNGIRTRTFDNIASNLVVMPIMIIDDILLLHL